MNILDNIYGKVNYKTYNWINKGVIFTSLSSITNMTLYPNSFNPYKVIMPYATAYLIFNLMFNNKERTKDYKVIKALYDEFIKNYSSLNKTMELNNPTQIMEMFDYMYANGYLSKDHKHEFSNGKCIDVDGLYGTTIFNGTGVCRHIASMLTDILKEEEIKAEKFTVSIDDKSMVVNMKPSNNQTKEEKEKIIKKYVKDDKECYDKLMLINMLTDDLLLEVKGKSLIDTVPYFFGNHLITISEFNNKCYILDPTNKYTYMKDGKTIYDKYDDKLKQCILDSLISNRSNIVNIINMLKLETSNKEDIISDINKVKIICEDNKDIFERFYNDNREIYEEVVDKTKVFIRK